MIDVLIVGGGGAGLSAAIEAKQNGINVTVVSKTKVTSSQTCQAQGGINAYTNNPDDSIQNHINDTRKSANGIGDDDTINYMCENAKETIEWLDNLAVPFSRDTNNNIAQRKLGGASHNRACYSSDYTGLKILHTLYDTCLKNNITFLEEYMLLSIIVKNNQAIGITVLNILNSSVEQLLAKKVILASGGYAGAYTNYNTNSYATTGDGVASAYRAGCTLSNMEYIQFHPTAMKENCILISESARGEGGYLVTKNGERFIDELKPRDIVARAIFEKIQNKEEVFLDLRHLGYKKIISSMPQEYELALQYCQLKMDKDLIPITPVAHYSMGGIQTNKYGHTNINNLYAIGECANNGVHGANRLGGNSLLEIILFGRVAGKDASKNLNNINIEKIDYDTYINDKKLIDDIYNYPTKINLYKQKDKLGDILYHKVGLFKNRSDLEEALNHIEDIYANLTNVGIEDKSKVYNTNMKEFIELKNMTELAILISKSAIDRRESRGAHYRSDYQELNKQYNNPSIIKSK